MSGVETLLGGAAADRITLGAPAPAGAAGDLGAGADRLVLAEGGPNSLTVWGTETILGGAADDAVALGAPVPAGASVDLGAGSDRLALSPEGASSVTARNTETILGGAGDDAVAIGAALAGAVVDLGGGADRLTLAHGGPNGLTVSNIETVSGGSGAFAVRAAVAQGVGHAPDPSRVRPSRIEGVEDPATPHIACRPRIRGAAAGRDGARPSRHPGRAAPPLHPAKPWRTVRLDPERGSYV